MTCKFRSTASISFALPCTTVNAGGGCHGGEYATRKQSDEGTLCGLAFSFQATQSSGGGLQEAIPGYRGGDSWRVHGKDTPYLSRKYSVPFPGPFSMMTSSTVLWACCSRACLPPAHFKKSNHESLERASTTQLGVFRVNHRLI